MYSTASLSLITLRPMTLIYNSLPSASMFQAAFMVVGVSAVNIDSDASDLIYTPFSQHF